MKRHPLGAGAEFALIASFLRGTEDEPAPQGVVLGPGDDCAIVSAEGVALSVDMSVEGVHFTRAWLGPEEIGYRAAAAAVSDLAAVAARPLGVLVALALPEGDAEFARSVMAGVRTLAGSVGAALLGGDLTHSPGPLVIDVVAVGSAPRPVLRSGASPGEAVWVTGSLGGPAAAVAAWRSGGVPDAAAFAAFARPQPRTAEAAWLAEHVAISAMIDLSDGLAGDVSHIAAAGDVGVVIDASLVPIHPSARAAAATADDALRFALGGGEDYELCLVTGDDAMDGFAAQFRTQFGVALTRVGEVVAAVDSTAPPVMLRLADGSVVPMPVRGYDHLREGGT